MSHVVGLLCTKWQCYACTFNIEGNIQCGIRFPTKGLLLKHKRDEGHILKRVQPNQDVNANVWANNNFILVLVVTVQHMFNWSLSKDRPTSPIKLCKSAKFIVFFLTEYHFIRGKIRPNILVVSSASHKIGIAIKYTLREGFSVQIIPKCRHCLNGGVGGLTQSQPFSKLTKT